MNKKFVNCKCQHDLCDLVIDIYPRSHKLTKCENRWAINMYLDLFQFERKKYGHIYDGE